MPRNLVPIAADSHGTPAPLSGTGSVIEKQAALRIGAHANRRIRSLGNDFGCRSGDGGKKPLEALLARHKLQGPSPGGLVGGSQLLQLIVAVGKLKDLIDGMHPRGIDSRAHGHCLERGTQAIPQLKGDTDKFLRFPGGVSP